MRWSRALRSASTTAARQNFTLWNTSQNPHVARLVIAAFVGMAPEHKLRVIAPDVGGGFGSKIFIYPEEVVCLWAAKKVGRPVKWTCDRSEAFLADAHGRDHVTHAEMAFGAGRQDHRAEGAARSPISAPTCRPSRRRCRPISMPRCCRASTTFRRSIARSTRSTPTPCRSMPIAAPAGRRRPSWSSGWSRSARANSASIPADLRKRNFIKSFPHQTPVIMNYDAGNYHASLKKAQEIGDVKGFGKRKREVGAHGQAARHRLFDLHRGLRHRAVAGGRLARRGRRPLGIRRGAGQSDRLGRGADRLPQPRPGSRNHVRATGLRTARHPDRHRQRRPRRHRQGAVRHGHLRLALRRGRHDRDRQGARQGRGQGQEGRGLHDGSRRGRHRIQGRQVHRRRHRQVGGVGRGDAQRLYRAQVHRRRSSSRA